MVARRADGRPAPRRPRAGRGWFALTGTPGTGKSTVARLLGPGIGVEEVGARALATGAGRRMGPGVEVDLGRLARSVRGTPVPPQVVVGHLAHLLPIRRTIVLRCHPVELGRRLARARRGTAADRRANAVAEATDLILLEATRLGRSVIEIDTTRRAPASVARAIRAWVLGGRPPRTPRIDWLADPEVPAYLLGGAR
ncbi:MAG TPA: AAA family ATPase [Thermoplasmata archaeon]|nr:AAA family ATPase [Thermoplasmata archaeon]